LTESLGRAAAAATRATADLVTFLREDLAPTAPERDGVGREMYAVTSRCFLGADVDLDDVYAYGWAELHRLTAEAVTIAHRLGATGQGLAAVREAAALLDGDASRRVDGVAALTAWLQQRVEDSLAAVDGHHFDVPAVSRAVECHVTPAVSGVMYYTPADAGLTRPAGIWWSLPPGTTSAAVWREANTLHHEGVPGHHLQHAVTLASADLHPWQRSLCHVHGYAEGWAHYAEELADEIGLLRDDAERLGMLLGQIWRAARIVIDVGLHLDLPVPAGNGFTDATRWTPGVGRAFLRDVAQVDETTARFEVDRYLGWPGQALAFRVGARLWAEARRDSESALGAAFDRKQFHARALGLGPMGLGPLRAALAPKTRS
jgi:uncharacterized protein (DUF885 family)